MDMIQMRKNYMTDTLFFDTDCISAFLWVNEEALFERMFKNGIVLPKPVFDELNNPSVRYLGRKIEKMCSDGFIKIMSIDVNSEEYEMYHDLAISPPRGKRKIGKGEVAAIALAKTYDGIIASNNLKDISEYVKKYQLKHTTTAYILCEALEKGYIDEDRGNYIWRRMLKKRRMLPTSTFTEYLSSSFNNKNI